MCRTACAGADSTPMQVRLGPGRQLCRCRSEVAPGGCCAWGGAANWAGLKLGATLLRTDGDPRRKYSANLGSDHSRPQMTSQPASQPAPLPSRSLDTVFFGAAPHRALPRQAWGVWRCGEVRASRVAEGHHRGESRRGRCRPPGNWLGPVSRSFLPECNRGQAPCCARWMQANLEARCELGLKPR